jgi:hypothetical protein
MSRKDRCRQGELLREQLAQRIRDLEQAEREIAEVLKTYSDARRALRLVGRRLDEQRYRHPLGYHGNARGARRRNR